MALSSTPSQRRILTGYFTLAGLYTLRVLGGIAATGVRFSAWLLAFSMFFFLSLAFMKRYTELIQGGRGVRELVARRGYMGEDRHWLGSVGACSGYMSVLVLALYITSDEVRVLYGHPEVLWLICPLLKTGGRARPMAGQPPQSDGCTIATGNGAHLSIMGRLSSRGPGSTQQPCAGDSFTIGGQKKAGNAGLGGLRLQAYSLPAFCDR